ncbi:MAG: 30S ribosomal protein S20 [Candidatus Lambdaproteobacteria bacterium RIFOXYD2_FULL_50_16]|uniref:Small ribosomal subunit protein bS20 n=1 Tax=Candidatus Lambdaproteobacteria bacterium RIFOXYD2_FULL_50_16 TaxID=1817772 RepID=A0A1F6GAU1_9PROT|nr:MAG: 30S ribosomal protein S20 [Candidatus Lambdaproteobacteria bacterium RIFOXYD2_FULL_50_16]
MANHKSALKRARQNAINRLRNRALRSNLRTEVKKFLSLITEGKQDEAKAMLPAVHKVIDKACTKGVITKANASRKKSRVTVMLNKAA